jgi:quinol monooxygenase YgiN
VAEELADAAGCRIYLVSHPADDPDSIWVTSIWTDRASHDAARSDERVQSLLQRAWPLIRARAEETELRPIGGKGV